VTGTQRGGEENQRRYW